MSEGALTRAAGPAGWLRVAGARHGSLGSASCTSMMTDRMDGVHRTGVKKRPGVVLRVARRQIPPDRHNSVLFLSARLASTSSRRSPAVSLTASLMASSETLPEYLVTNFMSRTRGSR